MVEITIDGPITLLYKRYHAVAGKYLYLFQFRKFINCSFSLWLAGPSTHSLHDLVLRLNSEDILLSEGLLKFNAFVFGLLNIRGLDTWLSLVATRESLVRRHYAENSLLAASCRGLTGARTLVDLLINALKPLNALPFKLDLLYQCRTLHESLCAMAKNSPVSPFDSSMSSLRTSWTLKKLIRSITGRCLVFLWFSKRSENWHV